MTSNKSSSKCRGPGENAKRRQVEDEESHVWGEPLGEKDGAREEFLRGEDERKLTEPSRQSKLVVLSGVEWWAHQMVKGLVASAATLGQ